MERTSKTTSHKDVLPILKPGHISCTHNVGYFYNHNMGYIKQYVFAPHAQHHIRCTHFRSNELVATGIFIFVPKKLKKMSKK
ncbi:hypothetical protein C923_04314 [Plasmodium falciparum UGT5.1]|uniref:Uncharacterized protein n=1 Tax=Plasmodium falciparum UGT5.1 TaxID=1237627 RepID=W7JJK4_PLAFA|nr:hypothetical protein C923_04314 [Plasmodium falciparum UGT5.1]